MTTENPEATSTPPAPPAPELATKDDLRAVHSRLQALEQTVGRCINRVEDFIDTKVIQPVVDVAKTVAGDVAKVVDAAAPAAFSCSQHPARPEVIPGCPGEGCVAAAAVR